MVASLPDEVGMVVRAAAIVERVADHRVGTRRVVDHLTASRLAMAHPMGARLTWASPVAARPRDLDHPADEARPRLVAR